MRFRGMDPLRERYPNIEVSDGSRTFDLHNDCLLVAVECHLAQRTVVIRFRSSKETSGSSRTKEAGIALELGGVSAVCFTGDLARADAKDEPIGLDFMEYMPGQDAKGQLRFVLDNLAEITVVAATCHLAVIGIDSGSP